jgi:hypothetical protein
MAGEGVIQALAHVRLVVCLQALAHVRAGVAETLLEMAEHFLEWKNLWRHYLNFDSLGKKMEEKSIPPPPPAPSLFTALKSSYGDKGASDRLTKSGYLQDTKLSDHRQQVWFNPQEKKLLMNVAGTHTRHDVLTDVKLAFGGFRALENSKRAKAAKATLEKAKQKYEPASTTVAGHSLGGSIAQVVGGKDDKIMAYNSGFTLFGKAKKGGAGSAIIRAPGDIISWAGKGQTTLKKAFKGPLRAHRLKSLKSSSGKYYV